MLRYKLSSLANRRRDTVVVLPGVHAALADETAYLKTLRQMLREMSAWCRTSLLPAYERQLAQIRADADPATWSDLDYLATRLVAVADLTVRRILVLAAKRNTDRFMAAAKRALGIDLSAVVRESDLTSALDQMAERNAALIKGLAEDVVKRIKDRTTSAVLAGESSASLRKTLALEFGFADNRAALIARDQIGKTTADLNRIRHQQAGISEYDWSTSADERVRPLHRSLNGRRYKYGEPTGAEQGLPPGQPVRCRCVALAVVEF